MLKTKYSRHLLCPQSHLWSNGVKWSSGSAPICVSNCFFFLCPLTALSHICQGHIGQSMAIITVVVNPLKKNLYMYTHKHFSLLAQCVLFGSNMEVKIAKKLLSAPACVYEGSHSFFLSLFSSCLNRHLELKEIITVWFRVHSKQDCLAGSG